MSDIPYPRAVTVRVGDTNRVADQKRQIVLLARELNAIGWGNQGNIVGIVEEVDMAKVWPNPLSPVEYGEDAIADMRESLQVEGMKDPIIVTAATDPRSLDQDGTGGSLLIVDGGLRYAAALRAGWDKLPIIAQSYQGMYRLMLDTAVRIVSRHTPTPLEIGRLILRIRVGYTMDCAQRSDMPPFPTQAELARILGRSQGTISQWLKLAQQPAPLVTLVDNEAISQAQAMELLRIPDDAARVNAAQDLAAQNVAHPVASPALRREVDARRATVTMPTLPPINYDDLLAWRLPDVPMPEMIAALVHDLQQLLALLAAAQPKAHPAVSRLMKALNDPAIQQFVADTTIIGRQ